MFESLHNNAEVHIKEISNHGQGSSDQAPHHVPPNFGQMPPILPKLANNVGGPNYWLVLVAELMKRIPPVPTKTSPKEDKLADRVARRNPTVDDGTYDLVVLEERVRGMEKIFTVAAVSKEKSVNIGTYYLTSQV